jgi:hypothetical protein
LGGYLDRSWSENLRIEKSFSEIREKKIEAEVPVAVPIAHRFVSQFFDCAQQFPLDRVSLTRLRHKLPPNVLCFLEMVHFHLPFASPLRRIRAHHAAEGEFGLERIAGLSGIKLAPSTSKKSLAPLTSTNIECSRMLVMVLEALI